MPPITTLLFDVDDTLYPSSSGIWSLIRQRMETYMTDRLGIDPADVPELRRTLYQQYGTTLRGLQATRAIDMEDYLVYVHDVPVEERLQPNPALKAMLASLPHRKILFTNADHRHAARVLAALGLESCFEATIDIHAIAPSCKPQPEAYRRALEIARVEDPRTSLFIDDSPANLAGAREVGIRTVLIGTSEPHPAAEICIPSLLDLPQALAELDRRE